MKQQDYQTLAPAQGLEKQQNSRQVSLGAAQLKVATPARFWLVRQHVRALQSSPGGILIGPQQKESLLTCNLPVMWRGEAG